jgi:hypothetical protein
VATSDPAVFAFLRSNATETLLVIANFSPEPIEVTFEGAIGTAGTSLVDETAVDLGAPLMLTGHDYRWIRVSA